MLKVTTLLLLLGGSLVAEGQDVMLLHESIGAIAQLIRPECMTVLETADDSTKEYTGKWNLQG